MCFIVMLEWCSILKSNRFDINVVYMQSRFSLTLLFVCFLVSFFLLNEEDGHVCKLI